MEHFIYFRQNNIDLSDISYFCLISPMIQFLGTCEKPWNKIQVVLPYLRFVNISIVDQIYNSKIT